jgi:hypothetical protein
MSAPPRHGPAGPRCEHREVLDIAGLRALHVQPLTDAGATLHVKRRAPGEPLAATLTFTREGIRIAYAHGETTERQQSTGLTELAAWRITPLHFGGVRYWIACPRCARRCRVLYWGVERLRCRLCLELRYASQLKQPGQRAEERAFRIARRLHPRGNALDGCPPRPKGMRRRTFLRLEAEYEHYYAIGVSRLMRQPGARRSARQRARANG